jgi:uncharacterized phage-associated protein
MVVSAHDVAAALRARLPDVGTKKLHKLLYYCQGHHLATLDVPLFSETISAWDMGPVVGTLWKAEQNREVPPPPAALGEAELNTIGYVVSRYGRMSGRELEILTHGEDPWQIANRRRRPGGRARIDEVWIREYFLTHADEDDEDEIPLDSEALTEMIRDAAAHPTSATEPDSLDELRARLSAGA